jgi:hypothetical protein
MNRYSEFFSTVYDEPSPADHFGKGAHYSVLRALVWVPRMKFHDFAVIWDEDHDQRILWVAEQLYVRLLLHNVLFIGERSTHVTVLTIDSVDSQFEESFREICGKVSSYCAHITISPFRRGGLGIIDASADQVEWYLEGIGSLWSLGTREPDPDATPV